MQTVSSKRAASRQQHTAIIKSVELEGLTAAFLLLPTVLISL